VSKKKGSDHKDNHLDSEPEVAPPDQDQVERPQEASEPVVGEAEEEVLLPAEREADLQRALDKARAEAEEYLTGWQRERAEFANYKKRVEREQEDSRQRIAGEILTGYLGVLDDLRRALKDRPAIPEAEPWMAGIELIHQKLLSILDANGVEPVSGEGMPFDPNLHEAVTYEESGDHQSGHVIEVLQEGYRLGDRILRPARVRVAK
jgi:molecular chaperone GrpE